jgi:predicted nuclease of predicted toxin-antitoxin system
MKITDFAFLTDENLSPKFVEYLIEAGLDIKDVKVENLFGKSDTFLLDLANQEGRVVITHDSDFGHLVFKKEQTCIGIIYLRPGHFDPAFTIASWETLVNSKIEVEPPFILVAEHTGQALKVRYRHLK